MKTRQLLAIALICSVGVIAGWSILQTRPPNPGQEQREERKAGRDEDKDTGLGKVQLAKEMVERSGIILEEAGPRKGLSK